MKVEENVCPHCRCRVDEDTRSYEERLHAAMHHSLPSTRVRICWILSRSRDRRAVSALLHMFEDEDIYVQLAALKGLGTIGDQTVIPVLQKASLSPSLMIRLAAAKALEALASRGIVQHESK
jgi:HEAT repeat protein